MRHLTFDDFKLHRAVLEIRYANGYRYWDVCGKCIVEINQKSSGILDFKELKGGEKCTLTVDGEPRAEAAFGFRHTTMEASCLKNVELFKNYAPLLFGVVKTNFGIEEISRIGMRFWLVHETLNEEAADEIINSIDLFSLKTEKFESFGRRVELSNPRFIVTNVDKTISLALVSGSRDKNFPQYDKELSEFSPKYCLLADFDFYRERVSASIDIGRYVHDCYKTIKDNISNLLAIKGQ